MTQQLISRADLARLSGVDDSTITRRCRTTLKPAIYGNRIDKAHESVVLFLKECNGYVAPDDLIPAVQEYRANGGRWSASSLKKHFSIGSKRARRLFMLLDGGTPTPPPPKSLPGAQAAKERKKSEGQPLTLEIPEDIEEFADMTLRDLVSKFGTDVRFVDWLKATNVIETINERRIKNATTRGLLVSRELVQHGVVEPINSAHTKLLSDGAKTIARRAMALALAGRPLEDIEAFVIDQISSFIRPVKVKMARALRDG